MATSAFGGLTDLRCPLSCVRRSAPAALLADVRYVEPRGEILARGEGPLTIVDSLQLGAIEPGFLQLGFDEAGLPTWRCASMSAVQRRVQGSTSGVGVGGVDPPLSLSEVLKAIEKLRIHELEGPIVSRRCWN